MAAKTVLVIDDSIMIRKMVVSILAGQFEVVEAKDGYTGLELARKSSPDLILLDFVMPKMDGYDTMQAIRRESDLQTTPIIIMSGLKEQVTSRIPEPFEGFSFIEKPFEAETLVNLIQKTLQVGAAPEKEPAGAGGADVQLVLNKLTAIETLFIQGTENLIQREVASKLTNIDRKMQDQDNAMASLEQQMDKLIHQSERQNQALSLIAKELMQVRKLFSQEE